jgi:hypothetical protein
VTSSGPSGSSAKSGQWMVTTTVIGAALSAVALAASSAAASSTTRSITPVPKTCPPASVVAATLKQKIRKVTSVVASTGSKRTCTYKTSFVVPTTITFGSPVTARTFAASQKAASKGVAVITVHGLGNAAWAVKRGNGLAVLKGTLDIVISAPKTTVAELEALARKIL